MENEGNSCKNLHVVMLPWLAMGHLIPFLELSKCLAQRGIQISFVSSPRNIKRLPRIPKDLSSLIHLISLPLPHIPDLPESAEATIDVPIEKGRFLQKAFDGLEAPFTNFLHNLTHLPNWIIYDFSAHWVPPLAAKLSVNCAYFSLFPAAAVAFFGPLPVLLGQQPRSVHPLDDDSISSPKWIPLSYNIFMRRHEILRMTKMIPETDEEEEEENSTKKLSAKYRLGAAVQGCDVVLIRSCKEFEPELMGFVKEEILQKPTIEIGLLPPLVQDRILEGEVEKWEEINKWLNQHKQESVVYVALGTEASLSQEEIDELAYGIELSELPFFWVFRKPPLVSSGGDKTKQVELPDGFKDRTRARGFVCEGWAPQATVLAHPSVTGFLTHCGWNSIVEGVVLGCALILFPCIWDQGLNSRLMEGKKLGKVITREEPDGWFTRETVAKVLRMVMVEEEGGEIRTKAREMKEMFGNKMLHDGFMDNLVQFLKGYKFHEIGMRSEN